MQFYEIFCNWIKIRSVDTIKKRIKVFRMFYRSNAPKTGVKLLGWVPLPLSIGNPRKTLPLL